MFKLVIAYTVFMLNGQVFEAGLVGEGFESYESCMAQKERTVQSLRPGDGVLRIEVIEKKTGCKRVVTAQG